MCGGWGGFQYQKTNRQIDKQTKRETEKQKTIEKDKKNGIETKTERII